MISDERLARMIVGNCTSSDLDEAFKELQTRRAADVELIAVLEKHAAANPPNSAAVLCAQVARHRRDNTIPRPSTPLYALVPQLINGLAASSAIWQKRSRCQQEEEQREEEADNGQFGVGL